MLAFPYDRELVEQVRTIPHRRFDWDTREWSAPADDWVGMKVAELLGRYPELTAGPEVLDWLSGVERRARGAAAARAAPRARNWSDLGSDPAPEYG